MNSPLILDFSGEGIYLSAPLEGVRFDIKGRGVKSQISWPLGDNTGFLVLDRNHNGRIDDVHELFGNNTMGLIEKLPPTDSRLSENMIAIEMD